LEGPAPSSLSAAAPSEARPGVDDELFARIQALAIACPVNLERTVVSCSRGELEQLAAELATAPRLSLERLRALGAALRDERAALRVVAAQLIDIAWRHGLTNEAGAPDQAVPEQLADALLGAVEALPDAVAKRALPLAAHTTLLARRGEAYYGLLQKRPGLAARGLGLASRYGRGPALRRAKEWTPKSTELLQEVFEGAARVPAWTASEQALLCPWALESYEAEAYELAQAAARALSLCVGAEFSAVQRIAEAAWKGQRLSAAQLRAFEGNCENGSGQADGVRCEAARAFLQGVVRDRSVRASTRGEAMEVLSHSFPDAETVALATALKQDAEPVVAHAAQAAMMRLTERGLGAPKAVKAAPP
jgi:hypothetical protein